MIKSQGKVLYETLLFLTFFYFIPQHLFMVLTIASYYDIMN